MPGGATCRVAGTGGNTRGLHYLGSVSAAHLVIEARKRRGLTQQALAQRLGVSPSTVSGWETERTQPTFAAVLRVFEACGLDLEVSVASRDFDTRRMLAAQSHLTPDELIDQLEAWAALRAAVGVLNEGD